MSKFGYMAEGELNSQYLLDLLNEYLDKILEANDTNGIIEDEYKIDPRKSRFYQWFNDKMKRSKYDGRYKDLRENYNKVLSSEYVKWIKNKLQIFLAENVLEAKQVFELEETLRAINFGAAIPVIDENRLKAINAGEKSFLKVLKDITYLQHAESNYILFNSPVKELKPFLSERVSTHTVDYAELQKLVNQFVDVRHGELLRNDFEPITLNFEASVDDFYETQITDNGVGEEVEAYIRSQMMAKRDIFKQEDLLLEEMMKQAAPIDSLLKKLKLNKIEQMMQQWIVLKTNQANAKEVIDKCKEILNASTICNKPQIFLLMDDLYYKLGQKCEKLEQKLKLKLQIVDKQKVFAMLDEIQSAKSNSRKSKVKAVEPEVDKMEENLTEPMGLYDDDEPEEISISEDDTNGDDHESEVVIETDEE